MAKSITHILVFEPRPGIYERAKVQGAQKKCVSPREKIRKWIHDHSLESADFQDSDRIYEIQ